PDRRRRREVARHPARRAKDLPAPDDHGPAARGLHQQGSRRRSEQGLLAVSANHEDSGIRIQNRRYDALISLGERDRRSRHAGARRVRRRRLLAHEADRGVADRATARRERRGSRRRELLRGREEPGGARQALAAAHFLSVAAVSVATALSVVCAAFRPRRKSLSLYVAKRSVTWCHCGSQPAPISRPRSSSRRLIAGTRSWNGPLSVFVMC